MSAASGLLAAAAVNSDSNRVKAGPDNGSAMAEEKLFEKNNDHDDDDTGEMNRLRPFFPLDVTVNA